MDIGFLIKQLIPESIIDDITVKIKHALDAFIRMEQTVGSIHDRLAEIERKLKDDDDSNNG